MKNLLLLLSSIMCIAIANAQQPIDVTESTLKVHGLGEETFYYGFAEGDKLVFSFEEVNGKELKEIEIIELPSSSKFMDYKTSKIENKILNINRTGIYKFRLANSAIAGRICKFKIQRIPASDATKDFNTSVYWKDVYDTTYTTEQEQYVARIDTTIETVVNTNLLVHSTSNSEGPRLKYNFSLPPNTVSWSYYIGVDQKGQAAFQNGVQKFTNTTASAVSNIPGYGAMAALALEGISFFSQLQSGENVNYVITDNLNASLFMAGQPYKYIKGGSVMNDYAKMPSQQGMLFFCLYNDNAIQPINVFINVTAIVVKRQIATRSVIKTHITSTNKPFLKS